MDKPITRDLRTTTTFKREIQTLAHERHETVSAMLRDFVEEYGGGLDRRKQKAPPADDQTRIHITVDEEDWNRAVERARLEGTNISEVIRKRCERELAL